MSLLSKYQSVSFHQKPKNNPFSLRRLAWEELPNGLTEWKSIETAASIQITAKVHVVAVEDQEDALVIWGQ